MAKTSESDVWDQDLSGGRAGSTFVRRTFISKAAKTRAVRDDWDDDDDDDDEEEEEPERDMNANGATTGTTTPSTDIRASAGDTDADSSVIWAEANKRAPMPELIVASASPGHILPPAAFQPALRILKRPSSNTSVNNRGTSSSVPFTSPSPGPASSSGSGSGAVSPVPRGTLAEREAQYQDARSRIFGARESSGAVVVVRDPLGPPEVDVGRAPVPVVKGFGERQRVKK